MDKNESMAEVGLREGTRIEIVQSYSGGRRTTVCDRHGRCDKGVDYDFAVVIDDSHTTCFGE